MRSRPRRLADRIRTRLTYANVMSTFAVFLLLGTGTAYAAGSIGSRQVIDDSLRSIDIKNDNLTGTDTKNGTLGAGELSADARNQLRPPAHYSGGGSQIVDTDDTDGLQEVTSLQVPAGNYLVVYTGRATNDWSAPTTLHCRITTADGSIGTPVDIEVGSTSVDNQDTIAINGGRDLFGVSNDISLKCVASNAAKVTVTGTLMAVQVQSMP